MNQFIAELKALLSIIITLIKCLMLQEADGDSTAAASPVQDPSMQSVGHVAPGRRKKQVEVKSKITQYIYAKA